MSSTRTFFLLGFLFSFVLVLVALYMQYVMLLEPCPLCILQRLAVMVASGLFLVAFLHHPKHTGTKFYGGLIGITALAGAGVSGWHIWLQNLPPEEVPSCGPGLDFIMGNFPLSEALAMVFSGSGECAEISWQFLGLSIPAWTLLAFIGMLWLVWLAIAASSKQHRRLF